MHISSIDLNLLVVLDAIYAEGSITRASERLNLSQPAVSHALARLRQMLDDPLFQRQGHRMAPTPVAQQAIGPVREALHSLERTLGGARNFDPKVATNRFTIGVRNHLEPLMLPKLLRHMRKAAPDVTFSFVRAERRELERELASGSLDAAIDVLLPLSGDIRRQRVGIVPLAVAARSGHPSIRSSLSLKTYLALEHIQVSARRSGPSLEDFELGRLGHVRRIRVRCQNYLAAWRMVADTDLLVTLPRTYAGTLRQTARNRLHAFPVEVPPLESHLYWHGTADGNPANTWLRTQLVAALR